MCVVIFLLYMIIQFRLQLQNQAQAQAQAQSHSPPILVDISTLTLGEEEMINLPVASLV